MDYYSYNEEFVEIEFRRLVDGDTSPVFTNLVYILWAVPTPICSFDAISLNDNSIPERCHTILQPISAEYGCVLAGSMEVIAVAKLKLARVDALVRMLTIY